MYGIVGITGTPGTGKKSVAPLVAAKLGLQCYALNDLARSLRALSLPNGVVDTDRLRRKMKGVEGPAVVYGHLLPYSVDRDAVTWMAVLRCEPAALKGRLMARGYTRSQLFENVEAELIGLESADAFDAFGPEKTFEVDTTRLAAAESASKVLAVVKGKRNPGGRLDWVRGYDTGAKLRSLLSSGVS